MPYGRSGTRNPYSTSFGSDNALAQAYGETSRGRDAIGDLYTRPLRQRLQQGDRYNLDAVLVEAERRFEEDIAFMLGEGNIGAAPSYDAFLAENLYKPVHEGGLGLNEAFVSASAGLSRREAELSRGTRKLSI